jgi:hypothetical protein
MIIISEDEQEGKKGKHTAPHTQHSFSKIGKRTIGSNYLGIFILTFRKFQFNENKQIKRNGPRNISREK